MLQRSRLRFGRSERKATPRNRTASRQPPRAYDMNYNASARCLNIIQTVHTTNVTIKINLIHHPETFLTRTHSAPPHPANSRNGRRENTRIGTRPGKLTSNILRGSNRAPRQLQLINYLMSMKTDRLTNNQRCNTRQNHYDGSPR